MALLLALACSPVAGTYLLDTTAWSTTCSLGGGGYVEPAAQYEIQAYIESETELWLDDHACTRTGLDYSCADDPIVQSLEGDATLAVTRVWQGAWLDPEHLMGDVSWATTCAGDGCATSAIELCEAAWSYSAVHVVVADG